MATIDKKYKQRYRTVLDVLLLILAFFFIIVGFLFGSARIDSELQFQPVRYGLIAFALIFSGTNLIVQVYKKYRK